MPVLTVDLKVRYLKKNLRASSVKMETLVARVHVLPVDGSSVLCLNVLAFIYLFF